MYLEETPSRACQDQALYVGKARLTAEEAVVYCSTRGRRDVALDSRTKPLVLIVGGPDVHQRIDLMLRLAPAFDMVAAGSDSDAASRFSAVGLPFHKIPLSRHLNPAADLVSLIAIVGLIRRVRPSIVHTFATKPSVWGRIAAHLAKTPVVIGTVPGLGSLFSSNRTSVRLMRVAYLWLQRTACRGASLTIFQNESDLKEFVEAGIAPKERAVVIAGSGVETARYAPTKQSRQDGLELRRSLGIDAGAVVVSMVSRLIRVKGVLEYARAARRLTPNWPKAVFLLVGPDDRESIDRLDTTELREVSASVRWLGERRDVAAILAATDLFVLPSYREGIPRVLIEAAAAGLPLVTTDVPGCQEVVIGGENGLLVPPRDVESLAGAIERLLMAEEERIRFGERSLAIARDRFDLAIVAKKTAEHYRHLLAQAGFPE